MRKYFRLDAHLKRANWFDHELFGARLAHLAKSEPGEKPKRPPGILTPPLRTRPVPELCVARPLRRPPSMEHYESALQAVRDALSIYAPNPELIAESIELEQAVRAASDAARGGGVSDDTLVEDLGRLAKEAIAHDAIGARSATHSMAKWARDHD